MAIHNRCGEEVSFSEVSKGYYAQCPKCDEDLYSFEVVKPKTAGELEQDERIRENMKSDLEYAIATNDLQMFEDIFEDRDPFEFL